MPKASFCGLAIASNSAPKCRMILETENERDRPGKNRLTMHDKTLSLDLARHHKFLFIVLKFWWLFLPSRTCFWKIFLRVRSPVLDRGIFVRGKRKLFFFSLDIYDLIELHNIHLVSWVIEEIMGWPLPFLKWSLRKREVLFFATKDIFLQIQTYIHEQAVRSMTRNYWQN